MYKQWYNNISQPIFHDLKFKKNNSNETKTVIGFFITKYWHCSPLTMTIRTQRDIYKVYRRQERHTSDQNSQWFQILRSEIRKLRTLFAYSYHTLGRVWGALYEGIQRHILRSLKYWA